MKSSSRRAGWLKPALLALLLVAAAAGGFYLSGGWPAVPPPLLSPSAPSPASSGTVPLATQCFPLTALDAKDTVEAPDLAADAEGRVYLTWASRTGPAERTVFLTRTADGGEAFTLPVAVSRGGVYRAGSRSGSKGGGYERRATPHLACDPGRVSLTWSEASTGPAPTLRLVFATSTDGGSSFGTPQVVHHGSHATPTFTGLAHGPGGAVACTWLDDRNGAQQPFAAVRPAGATEFAPELLVHAGQEGKGVCPCCPTAACFSPDGTLYVAFRNVADGYRDVAVSRLRRGADRFEGPFPVVSNAWKFDGCPHDGPSLAVVGETLHVVWMDARAGAARCYHGLAKLDGGASAARSDPTAGVGGTVDNPLHFQTRELHPAGPGTQGNARLLVDSRERLHVVWEESLGAEPVASQEQKNHTHGGPQVGSGPGRAIQYARLAPGEDHFGPAYPLLPHPGAFQTRPTLTATPTGDLLVAWNELDEAGKSVVVIRLPGEAGQPAEVRRE